LIRFTVIGWPNQIIKNGPIRVVDIEGLKQPFRDMRFSRPGLRGDSLIYNGDGRLCRAVAGIVDDLHTDLELGTVRDVDRKL
jgi:hypothetical protein